MNAAVAEKASFSERMLAGIEKAGNKVPHPVMIFVGLIGIVVVLSAVLALFDVQVTTEVAEPAAVSADYDFEGGTDYVGIEGVEAPNPDDIHIETETIGVNSLLSVEGIRFMLTSPVQNFNNFGVVGVIIIAMLGIGVAEEAGFMAAIIRKVVKVSPPKLLTFFIVLSGMISSVATDAGYLVLIPLGAVAFMSVGRNPIAGIAAAFAGVSAGFGVNFLVVPLDGMLAGVTNEAMSLSPLDAGGEITVTSNFFFGAASTLLITIIITLLSERYVEPLLGRLDPADVPEDAEHDKPLTTDEQTAEAKGLRYALWATIASVAVILALALPPGAPLRNPETGSLVVNAPLMDSLIILITLIFLVIGVAYGKGAGTMSGSKDIIAAMTKTVTSLGGLIFMLTIVAQFIAYFNYTNMATIAAVSLANVLEAVNIGAIFLLLGFILLVTVLNIIMPGALPLWAIMAPIFIPLFMQLGVAPAAVLAAYRVGDGPTNVITPLMVYLSFVVLIVQRYRKSAGMGTVVSMMLPYTIVLTVLWTAFYLAWYALNIPWGPGFGSHMP